MDARISTYYPAVNKIKKAPVFGYCTKGIPGLEIIGLGKYGKSIKEKFIYLTRKEKIKIPMKRYVICVEGDPEDLDHILENNRWFELPMLILYWSMAEQLPIRKLEDCICAGKVDVSGRVINADFACRAESLIEEDETQLKMIAPEQIKLNTGIPLIPLEEIFKDIGTLSIC